MIDLNVKHKTINLLEGNIGENLQKLGVGEEFLDMTTKAQFIKEKMDKLDFIKMKNFCSCKRLLRGWKDNLQAGRKYIQTTYMIRESYLEFTKNSQKFNSKNTNNSIRTWVKDMRHFTEEDI